MGTQTPPDTREMVLVKKWVLTKARQIVKSGVVSDRIRRFVNGEIKDLRIPVEIVLNDGVREAIRKNGAVLDEERL